LVEQRRIRVASLVKISFGRYCSMIANVSVVAET
jgi:hypothetical protein